MRYFAATIIYLSIGICAGTGFGNKINEIESTIEFWLVLCGGTLFLTILTYYFGKVLFPDMKFRLIHSFLCIGSTFVLSYFFIITKMQYILLILFITIPIGVFFAAFLILLKFLEFDRSSGSEIKFGEFINNGKTKSAKGSSATMLKGVSEIRDYVEKKK